MPDISLGRVPGGSDDLAAYLAVPSGTGPWPTVVALHEIFGLDDLVRRQADRLAAAGYLTLAPDLYSDGGKRRCLVSTFRALFSGQGKPFADIEAARAHLLADERGTGKVGVIGFCMGGGFALRPPPGASTWPRQLRPAAQEPARGAAGLVPGGGQLRGEGHLAARGGGQDPHGPGHAGGGEGRQGVPDRGTLVPERRVLGPGFTHALQRVTHLGPDPQAAPDAWARIESFFGRHLA